MLLIWRRTAKQADTVLEICVRIDKIWVDVDFQVSHWWDETDICHSAPMTSGAVGIWCWLGSIDVMLTIFTALHVMQTRYCDENSVCPSVRPSVTRVNCDKTVERSVQIYIPYERTYSLIFWEEEWLVRVTLSTWNFGSTGPRWSIIADFQPIIARSSSAVTPNEKSSINANRKSTTRFPMSLRWSSYVAPKSSKGVWTTQNGRFA